MVLLLIAGVIITMILANRKHVQQEVKIALMQADYEKELRLVESEVQEEVLSNVARELHDNIGQLLTLIRIQLEQEKLDDEVLTKKLEPVDGTLSDTIDQVRMLSHSLNTEYLENKGLAYAIEKEVNRISQIKKLKVNWEYDAEEDGLDKGKRVMVFRIFQELLNNSLKHSGAKQLDIVLSVKNNFVLSVKDNGRGFDTDIVLNGSEGSGLQNIIKRAKLAGMQMDIKSARGEGSIFKLSET